MNPTVITAIIAAASFILAVFGAGWLNQQAMNKRIDDLRYYLDAEFKATRAEVATVRSEVASLNQRVDRIERQLDQIFKPLLPRT